MHQERLIKLTAEQRQNRFEELARLMSERKHVAADKKAYLAEVKDKLGQLDAEIDSLVSELGGEE